MKSVFRKRKPVHKGAEEVVRGIAQPPPHLWGTGWVLGLTIQGQLIVLHTSCYVFAHYHFHIF